MIALVVGASGQDGFYLVQLLISSGYKVIGTSRNLSLLSQSHLSLVASLPDFKMVSLDPCDRREVENLVRSSKPDEIYNLAGLTSVARSFDQPFESYQSIIFTTLNLLETIHGSSRRIKLFCAGSSESFGDMGNSPANETSHMVPTSPYGVSKAAIFLMVRNYRESYGVFACTGLLFNHESPIRPPHFVTQKIVKAAALIARQEAEYLELGNIDIFRDWGWAPDYVEAMHLMLQKEDPVDYVIATGETNSLTNFVERAFDYFGLRWIDHVRFNNNLKRQSELTYSAANPSKAMEELSWSASYKFDQVVDALCESATRKKIT